MHEQEARQARSSGPACSCLGTPDIEGVAVSYKSGWLSALDYCRSMGIEHYQLCGQRAVCFLRGDPTTRVGVCAVGEHDQVRVADEATWKLMPHR